MLMKKIIFFAMICAMGLSFAACEPQLIDGPDAYATVDSEALAAGITYTQYADKELTQPDPAGNFVKYNSALGVVQVFSETGASPLITGAGGTFKLPVKRGHVGDINMRFRLINADGTLTWATKTFACTPPSELTRDQILLTGDYGKKVWMYDQTFAPWGKAGYIEGEGAMFDAVNAWDSWWWGVADNETFVGQVGNISDKEYGDENMSAYMVFDEDGLVQTFAPNGTLIRKGGFQLKDYDETRASGWELGKLTTSEPAILFPWDVTGSGAVTEFDVMYLTPQNMTLAYVPAGAADWGTITYWRFVSGTPDQYTLEGKWSYGTELNSRYSFAYGDAPKEGEGFEYNVLTDGLPGFSWGYAPDRLAEKSEIFAERGQVFGDAAEGAYMVFDEDWVTTYSPTGEKVREATWSITMNDPTVNGRRGDNGIELGTLTTTGPGLLFPWTFQDPGVPVTEYQIMYYDSNNIVLIKQGPENPEYDDLTLWVFSRVEEESAE